MPSVVLVHHRFVALGPWSIELVRPEPSARVEVLEQMISATVINIGVAHDHVIDGFDGGTNSFEIGRDGILGCRADARVDEKLAIGSVEVVLTHDARTDVGLNAVDTW